MTSVDEETIVRRDLPVLVVEDDEEVRFLLQREIAERGHLVTAVENGEQAIDALLTDFFAVAITDIRMPGMDGVELTRRIKQISPATEVILITGYASVDSASSAVQLGASDYLTKPLGDINRISESLDRAIARYRRAARARLRASRFESYRDTLARMLDHLPIGVILLDREGRALVTNRTARPLLDDGDTLHLDHEGRLQAGDPGESSTLRRLIEGTVRHGPGQRRRGGVGTLTRTTDCSPITYLVSPIKATDEPTPEDPAAVLFIGDPERRAGTTEALLCQLYALTPTEGRIAAMLMQGKSVEEVATELHITTNTTRTHLKRIFGKTNTSRQGDLISLLFSGPALLHRSEEH